MEETFAGNRPSPQMFDKPGPDHVHNCSPVQYLGIYPRLYLLVVRARLIFMFKETVEVALPS